MKKVFYSLTGRGLYSELMNLILAIIYCENNNLKLIVNSYHWNSRNKKGWTDYFENTLESSNQFVSSQVYFDGNKHLITLRGIYKTPIREISHLCQCPINYFYKKKTSCLMSDDIIAKMRSNDFITKIGQEEKWIELFSRKLEDIYVLNNHMREYVMKCCIEIGIHGKDYIGIHIRRGDKIRSNEMDNLDLELYVNAIKEKSEISKNIYIATDDNTIIQFIQNKLSADYNIFYNIFLDSTGFDESRFNRKNKSQRVLDTCLAILDVEILRKSTCFIGTYSSNLSRIMPCFKGVDKCKSIDIQWKPVF